MDLTIKAKNPQQVRALQERVQQGVMDLEEMKERLAQAHRGRALEGAGGLLGLVAGRDLQVSSREIGGGMVVSFTSHKPHVVQTLH